MLYPLLKFAAASFAANPLYSSSKKKKKLLSNPPPARLLPFFAETVFTTLSSGTFDKRNDFFPHPPECVCQIQYWKTCKDRSRLHFERSARHNTPRRLSWQRSTMTKQTWTKSALLSMEDRRCQAQDFGGSLNIIFVYLPTYILL
jgi:hypothetical protein